jgi:hypothetical protein
MQNKFLFSQSGKSLGLGRFEVSRRIRRIRRIKVDLEMCTVYFSGGIRTVGFSDAD